MSDGHPLRLCDCQPGGTLLSWAWETEDDYDAYYADIAQFHQAQQIEEGFPVATERDAEHLLASQSRVRILRSIVMPPRWNRLPKRPDLCDIGCGTGAFVQAAQEGGFWARGVEPCTDLVEWARRKNRNVQQGSWWDIDSSREWDVITLHDVLEHLTQPARCLSVMRAHLAPKGVIVVEMPEWDSPHQRAEGMTWRHIRPRQHLWLASRAAAEAVFARAGLEVFAWHRPLGGALGKAVWFLQLAS